jgi:hypothetical protein
VSCARGALTLVPWTLGGVVPAHEFSKKALSLPREIRKIEARGEEVVQVFEHDDKFVVVTRGFPKRETR